MSAESEDPSTGEDSGCDGGSPAGSEEDGRLSPRSRKTPDGSRWSFSATFIVQFQNILSAEEVTTKSAEVFQHAFLDREEAKEYLGPRFVKYMLVLFDSSCVQSPKSHEDNCHQYRIPIRGYLECKKTTIHKLYGWMPEEMILDVKWSASSSNALGSLTVHSNASRSAFRNIVQCTF